MLPRHHYVVVDESITTRNKVMNDLTLYCRRTTTIDVPCSRGAVGNLKEDVCLVVLGSKGFGCLFRPVYEALKNSNSPDGVGTVKNHRTF